jgi:hypothetical protein
MADKVTEIVLDALKLALAEPAEQRLYKSGKLPGLFPGRAGANGEAAALALREGLLEVVRTETKGKTVIEWVRVSPRGVEFLHNHESPLRALEELRSALQGAREGVPVWLAEMRRDLQNLGVKLAEDAQRWLHRLEALSQRVEEGLRRLEADSLQLPDGTEIISWAKEALSYLDRRRAGAAGGPCPLPELFAALRAHHADLTVTVFHDGLRLLRKRHALRLLPFNGPPSELPEPEYALLDGAEVLYYVARS